MSNPERLSNLPDIPHSPSKAFLGIFSYNYFPLFLMTIPASYRASLALVLYSYTRDISLYLLHTWGWAYSLPARSAYSDFFF